MYICTAKSPRRALQALSIVGKIAHMFRTRIPIEIYMYIEQNDVGTKWVSPLLVL